MIAPEMRELARRLYVQDGWTVEEISAKVRAAKSSVERWRSAEDWNGQRHRFVETETAFSTRTFSFATKLMEDIERDYAEDKEVSAARLNLLKTVFDRVSTIRSVEEQIKENREDEAIPTIPPEVMADPEIQAAVSLITRRVARFEAARDANSSKDGSQTRLSGSKDGSETRLSGGTKS